MLAEYIHMKTIILYLGIMLFVASVFPVASIALSENLWYHIMRELYVYKWPFYFINYEDCLSVK